MRPLAVKAPSPGACVELSCDTQMRCPCIGTHLRGDPVRSPPEMGLMDFAPKRFPVVEKTFNLTLPLKLHKQGLFWYF